KTCDWHGFSFLVEGEFVQSVIDDYNAGGGANPIDAANSPINDPRNHELNQAYVCYRGEENVVRIGRQRLVFDNTAFVGNVGWRQNEQTYDAFSLTNTSLDGFTLNFAYIDGVRRIFGVDAVGPFRQLDTDIILLNGTYDGFRGITLGA